MVDTLRRQWVMLTVLPKRPRKVDTATIEAHLRARGMLVTRRTIQRDLMMMATELPIVCDGRSKPFGWSWEKDSPSIACSPALEDRIPGVGQRSSTETIVAILQAFLERRTWSQAELARHLGVSAAVVKQKLAELSERHLRLERQEDHPHVYWSVGKDWFPGGVLFKGTQLPELLRQLGRLPRSKAREELIATVLRHLPGAPGASGDGGVVPPTASAQEDEYLAVVEDAARQRTALRMRYFTASRGSLEERHASVHRVVVARPARFIATCHKANALKWFRVENIMSARLDSQEEARATSDQALEAFDAASLDGFNQGGSPVTFAFFVREPESRWVERNLLERMRSETVPGGVRVTVETNGLLRLARYVVGLGAAARSETPALAEAVAELARGALQSAAPPATTT